MNKVMSVFQKCFLWIYAILYVAIFILLLFGQGISYYRKRNFVIPNLVITVLFLVIFLGIVWWRKERNEERSKVNRDNIIKVASILLFFFQIFICINIFFMAGFDSKIITANADHLANGRITELNNWYYSRCANNTLITAIYAVIFWVVEHIGISSRYARLMVAFLQCGISTLTGAMIYQCTRRVYKQNRWALIAWVLYVLLLGLSPWLVVPYSDSSCLFLPILSLWIYQSMIKSEKKAIKALLLGVLAALSYELKPMGIIVFMAILIVEFCHGLEKKEYVKLAKMIGIMLLSFAVAVGVYKAADLLKVMGYEINEEQELGMPHYFMMGLNDETSGTYWIEDTEFSAAIETREKRTKINLQVAKERIKNYGVKGLSRHLAEKTLANFNDGTFSWGQEGGFYDTVPGGPNIFTKEYLRNYYYDKGKYHKVYEMFTHIVWIMIMTGVMINGILSIKNKEKKKENQILLVSLIGIALFVTLFEGRARYLFTFAPLYILAAVGGYQQMCMWLLEKKSEFKKAEREEINEKEQ